MSVLTILKDAVPAGGYFSYGTTFDHNIVIEMDAWMYLLEFPLRGVVDVELSYTRYECILLVGKFSKFELEVNEHIDTIDEAEQLAVKYVETVWSKVNSLTDVRTSHFKNRYDANLSGVRISFIVDVPLDCDYTE